MTDRNERLRRSARDLIDHGVPPPSGGGSLSVEALQLLYRRASDPDSAADAVKLLHELQTYQVELDLLYEQIRANEQELSEELAHHIALFREAPVAYLVVANDGVLVEANAAAEALFARSPGTLAGVPLVNLLAPGQQSAVNALLHSDSPSEPSAAGTWIRLANHRRGWVTARRTVNGDTTLLVISQPPED